MNDRKNELESTGLGEEPKINELIDRLHACSVDGEDYQSRIEDAHDARFAIWDGQSEDGRKHEAAIGAEAFPWEGASDTRLRRIESIINELKATLLLAFHRGTFQATGIDSDADPAAAARISPLLRYIFRNRMRCEIRNELNYLLNWMLTYGSAVLWIDWRRELRMEEKEITLEQMQTMAIQKGIAEAQAMAAELQLGPEDAALMVEEAAAESLESLNEKIFSDEYRPVAIEMLTAASESIDRKTANIMLDELRDFEVTTYPNPYTHTNQPRWTALRPGYDIFFNYLTDDLQNAEIFRAEILTRAELEAKELEEGWNPDFIAMMLAKAEGVMFQSGLGEIVDTQTDRGLLDNANRTYGDRSEEYRNQFQVFHCYYRGKDKKGFPVVFRTVMSPAIKGPDSETPIYALHEICPYDHGMIPAIEFRREWFHRPILESRGVAEIAQTAQNDLKTHRDALNDQASITSSPPLIMPRQRSGVPIVFGPGRQIPEHRAQSMRWMDPPRNDGRTETANELIETDLALYWGLQRESVPADMVVAYKMVLTEDFLTSMGDALTMTVALLQQYMDPMVISRVTNAPPEEISAEDIRGRYDLAFEFDPRDLLGEAFEGKVKFFEVLAKFDTSGVLNNAAMMAELANSYSPTMAERIIKAPEQAQKDEIAEEKAALAMMASGVEPPMIEGGQNHALRAQVLQQEIQKSQKLMQQFQEDPEFQAMAEARLQHHQHQVEQRENAAIGRLGADSALPLKQTG